MSVLCVVLAWYLPFPCLCCFAVTDLEAPSELMTQGAPQTTSVTVSWSEVSVATGYYVSYQRQDLGAVVTPQYERLVGLTTTSVTLKDLVPGTTYRIRVWSTNGTSVSSVPRQMDVKTMESGEMWCEDLYKWRLAPNRHSINYSWAV